MDRPSRKGLRSRLNGEISPELKPACHCCYLLNNHEKTEELS